MKNKNIEEITIMDMVEEELHSINKIKDVSLSIRRFNKLKYPEPKFYDADDIVRIRRKLHVSQSVLAYLINIKVSTIQKWERGINHPNGPANRLLQIIERRGIKVLQPS